MSLQDQPPEIVEEIVKHLPLSGTCSLRLTGRIMASKATQLHFKANFHSKTAVVNRSGLAKFMRAAESGGLCRLLRHLTLVGSVCSYETVGEEAWWKTTHELIPASADDNDGPLKLVVKRLTAHAAQIREDALDALYYSNIETGKFCDEGLAARQLEAAFNTLAFTGVTLSSIIAEVAIYQQDGATPSLPLFGGDYIDSQEAAEYLTRLLLEVLGRSRLHFTELNLFNSSRMVGCSPAIDALNKFDFGASPGVLRKLTSLSLSISESDAFSKLGLHEVDYSGLSNLLHSCPGLEELDLAGFSLEYANPKAAHDASSHRSERILQALNEAELPKLLTLKLHGIHVTRDLLLDVLRRLVTLRRLSLRSVGVCEGTFQTIFDYCTQETGLLDLHLDSVYNTGIMWSPALQFEAPWAIDPTDDGHPCLKAHWRKRIANRKITHREWLSEVPDQARVHCWAQDMRNWFGPPQRGHFRAREVLKPEELWRWPGLENAVWEDEQ